MRIEHVALYTFDLEKLKRFYTAYFGAVGGKPYHNPGTGLCTCFLTFSDGGGRLELMTRPPAAKAGAARLLHRLYPSGLFAGRQGSGGRPHRPSGGGRI